MRYSLHSILPIEHTVANVYEIVTDKIISQLESGVAPWRKPWTSKPPANLISQKEYRGLNTFLLGSQGFASRYWLTFNQAKKLAGRSGRVRSLRSLFSGTSAKSARSLIPKQAQSANPNLSYSATTPFLILRKRKALPKNSGSISRLRLSVDCRLRSNRRRHAESSSA